MNVYFCKYILPLYTFPLWRFQWSCQVASSGAGCLVYSGASRAPQRLEEALDTGTLARSARALTTCIRHVLPSRTLVPGTYVFTVTVSKGNLSSEASMKVGLGQTLSSSSSHTNAMLPRWRTSPATCPPSRPAPCSADTTPTRASPSTVSLASCLKTTVKVSKFNSLYNVD